MQNQDQSFARFIFLVFLFIIVCPLYLASEALKLTFLISTHKETKLVLESILEAVSDLIRETTYPGRLLAHHLGSVARYAWSYIQ